MLLRHTKEAGGEFLSSGTALFSTGSVLQVIKDNHVLPGPEKKVSVQGGGWWPIELVGYHGTV